MLRLHPRIPTRQGNERCPGGILLYRGDAVSWRRPLIRRLRCQAQKTRFARSSAATYSEEWATRETVCAHRRRDLQVNPPTHPASVPTAPPNMRVPVIVGHFVVRRRDGCWHNASSGMPYSPRPTPDNAASLSDMPEFQPSNAAPGRMALYLLWMLAAHQTPLASDRELGCGRAL
jgi:hypothetical protein